MYDTWNFFNYMEFDALKRVVITGVGCVTPMGYGAERLFDGISNGESAVKRMPEWEDYSGLPVFWPRRAKFAMKRIFHAKTVVQ